MRIKRHVRALAIGKLFSTRDLLEYGKRGAVDQTTRRMVNEGSLQRVARGVFCRMEHGELHSFSAPEVLSVKATAFGKQTTTLPDPRTFLDKRKITTKASAVAVAGCRSKFVFATEKVTFDPRAPRKVKVGQTSLGPALLAHWAAGSQSCSQEKVPMALSKTLNVKQLNVLFAQFRLLPAWINDCVCVVKFASSAAAA